MKASLDSVLKVALPAVVAAAFAVAPAVSGAAEQSKVAYRLEKWKTVEFEDAGAAKSHFDTVKKLGCEANKEDHQGHIDVRYRCPKWKEMTAKDHDDAHRWQAWLKKAGFETRHSH